MRSLLTRVAKAVCDSMALDSPWLNLMRNSMNAHIWSFDHPDSLSTSATHGSAVPAIFDEAIWGKYRFASLADRTNNFLEDPVASHRNLANLEAPDGASCPMGNIAVLQHRRAVLSRYHNAIWNYLGILSRPGSTRTTFLTNPRPPDQPTISDSRDGPDVRHRGHAVGATGTGFTYGKLGTNAPFAAVRPWSRPEQSVALGDF